MVHPARRLIESLHAKGACPRIQVDVTRDGVVCPDFVREKWQERLVIDLDPSYPLNLSFTDVALEADISFGGFVTRCTFPFNAVYMVVDRESGKGIMIEENIPASVATHKQEPSKPQRSPGRESKTRKSRRHRRPRPEPAPETKAPTGLAPVQMPDAPPPDESSKSPSATDEEAKSRRSRFQVIDGDG